MRSANNTLNSINALYHSLIAYLPFDVTINENQYYIINSIVTKQGRLPFRLRSETVRIHQSIEITLQAPTYEAYISFLLNTAQQQGLVDIVISLLPVFSRARLCLALPRQSLGCLPLGSFFLSIDCWLS